MDKSITITKSDAGIIGMTVTGLEQHEILGLLRFYEKAVWLNMQKQMAEQSNDAIKTIPRVPQATFMPLTEKGYKITDPNKTKNNES